MNQVPIKRVEIKNYKCLRDVVVDLSPLTVLIGKNDTGKSAFIEIIRLIAKAAIAKHSHYLRKEILPHCAFGASKDEVSIRCVTPNGPKSFSLHNNLSDDFHIIGLTSYAGPYRLQVAKLRNQAQTYALEGRPLPEDGANLVDALDRMPHKRFGELQETFTKHVPTIKEVLMLPVTHGQKQLFFEVAGTGRVSADFISDGPLLLLAFLAIVYDEESPQLIMIEEPENGVHPKQLEHIIRYVATLTERNNPVQVVMTTHSPYLLDFVPPESVRVFTRGKDGDTHVHPMAEIKKVKKLLEEGYSMGEVWYNTDEDELVAGEKP